MKKRIFLAIPLPKDMRAKIAKFGQKLVEQNNYVRLKAVKADNLHITLHFLGDQSRESVDKINALCQEISAKAFSFKLKLGRSGAFPSVDFPRIILVNIVDNDELKDLRKKLGVGLLGLGIDLDTRFWNAHVTVARVKGGKPEIREFKGGEELLVDRFELVSSKLGVGGPIYEVLEVFKLL